VSSKRRFIFTVKQINRYLKALFAQDRTLQEVWVRGEVADIAVHRSGHVYFTLQDESSRLRVVLFREYAQDLSFVPADGEQVVAGGAITIYEPRGQYQLLATTLERAGIGDLHLAFERLRRKLAEEGLFAEERKRPLPRFPRRIAVLTSPVGAAVHDILTTIGKRWPSVEVVLVPIPVSGASAAPGIARGLSLLGRLENVQTAILARGGGSAEELAGFNSEEVARAIAASPIPVVTGRRPGGRPAGPHAHRGRRGGHPRPGGVAAKGGRARAQDTAGAGAEGGALPAGDVSARRAAVPAVASPAAGGEEAEGR